MALSGWNIEQRIICTIVAADVPAALTDFPVLVNLSALSGVGTQDVTEVFDKLGTDYLKIAVEDGDTGNQCYVEVEAWDNLAETAQLWVKLPAISDTANTVFTLYYDETQADNSTYVGVVGSTPGAAVWDNNYAHVYHLSQAPGGAGTILDSLGTVDGTSINMESTDVAAAHVGKGLLFDGVNENVTFGFGSNMTTATAEISIKAIGSASAYDGIFTPQTDTGATAMALIVNGGGTGTSFYRNNTGESSSIAAASFTSWNHLSCHISTTSEKITNHTQGTSNSASDTIDRYFHADSSIGLWTSPSTRYWPGIMRGLFISSVVRSDDWLDVSYKSRTDSLVSFATLTIGDVELTGAIGFGGTVNVDQIGKAFVDGAIAFGGGIDVVSHASNSLAGSFGFSGNIEVFQTGQLAVSGALGFGGDIAMTAPQPVVVAGTIGFIGSVAITTFDCSVSGAIGFGGTIGVEQMTLAGISGALGFCGSFTIAGTKTCTLPTYGAGMWA